MDKDYSNIFDTLLSFILQSLICRSSAPLMIKGMVGWKLAQFTPLVGKIFIGKCYMSRLKH